MRLYVVALLVLAACGGRVDGVSSDAGDERAPGQSGCPMPPPGDCIQCTVDGSSFAICGH